MRICILAILTTVTGYLVAQPGANFSISKNSGCAPLANVQFTDLSTGNPTSWVWKRNGVQFSTLQNPSATFSTPGSYTIQLTATNTSGSNSTSKTVTVFANPNSNFAAIGSRAGCNPFTVSFADQSSASSSSSISSWLWSFGDGGQSSLQNPNHTYTLSGNFPVSLKVIDNNGCEDTRQRGNYVTVNSLPSAHFASPSTRHTCAPPLTVNFINNSTGNGTLTYLWNFGDGNTSTSANPSHTYQIFGSFDVELVVTDGNGCVDSVKVLDYIKIEVINADFTFPKDSICLGDSVKFTDISSGSLISKWNFGDGNTANGNEATHAYQDSGWFNVRLVASVPSAGCSDTVFKQIYVEEVIADFAPELSYICEPGKIAYLNQSINEDFYSYRLGKNCPTLFPDRKCGQVVVSDTATYSTVFRPDIEGIWSDTIIAWSKLGCYDTMVLDTSVIVNFVRAGVNLSKVEGCRPYNINFTGAAVPYKPSFPTINPPPTITSTVWKIEDTLYSTLPNAPPLNVVDTGIWYGKFIVENSEGCRDSVIFDYRAGDSVHAAFFIQDDTVCVNGTDSAFSLSQDTTYISNYIWSAPGSELGQKGRKAAFVPQSIGSYNVRLVVDHHGCADTAELKDAFYAQGPVVGFNYSIFDCIDSTKIQFNSSMQQADRFYWDFGDSSIPIDSTSINPTVIYPKTGVYTVRLTAYNKDTSCMDEFVQPVYVYQFGAFLRASDDVPKDTNLTNYLAVNGDTLRGCVPYTVNFSSYLSSGTGGNWVIDGNSYLNVPHNNVISHTFNSRGYYPVQLITYDTALGCTDTARCIVAAYDPQANFTGSPSVGCTPLTAILLSNVTSIAPIDSFIWNVGPIRDTSQNFNHSFNTDIDYDASLRIINAYGCEDEIVKKNFVRSSSFDIYLVASSIRQMCTGDSIRFVQTLPVNDVSYTWIFGDGDTSYLEQPYHTYNDSGTFDVTLIARDSVGCIKTQVRPGYIEVQQTPVADFRADRTDSTCYPLPVQFYADTNIIYYNENSYLYSLGDFQAMSNYRDPFYNYVRPGSYTVELTVTTTFGCKDKEKKVFYINVGGPYGEIDFYPDSICRGDSITFELINPINAGDYGWDFGDGIVTMNQSPVAHQYTDTVGRIFPNLFFTDSAGGCPKTFTDTVYIVETVADFSFDTIAGCVSFNPNLVNTSTMSNYWYWDYGDGEVVEKKNPEKVYNAPGTYIVELIVNNAQGCSDTMQQEFIVFPLPNAYAASDTLICEGDTIQLFASGGDSYKWLPDNTGILNTLIPNPLATPRKSINYSVRVRDSNWCKDVTTVEVLVQNPIVLHFDDPLVMIVGEKLELIKGQDPAGLKYSWEPSTGLDCDTCPAPILTALESGTYTVTVTDTNGCFESASSFYLEVRDEYTLDVPQAFTPNGDGVNDVIRADGWGILDLITFRIYNRWGEKLFESSELEIGWDGTFKGKPMEMDTYVYYVEGLTYGNTTLKKKGEFTLIR